MSIEFDAASTARGGAGGAAATAAHTVTNTGSGRVLLALSHVRSWGSTLDVTYGGETLTQLHTDSPSASIFIHYLLNPPTGSNTFSSDPDSADDTVCVIVSYTGVNTGSEAEAFGSINHASGTNSLSDTIAAALDRRVISAFFGYRTSLGNAQEPTTTETDQARRAWERPADGDWISTAISDSPGATSVDIGWDYTGTDQKGDAYSFVLKPAEPVRERAVRYLIDTYASRRAGRLIVIDARSGQPVPPEQIEQDQWAMVNGPNFPTTRRYSRLSQDPGMGYIRGVKATNVNAANPRAMISVTREDLFEFVLGRLARRSR